ncbi:type I methionyl aminopeptidase [Candidatus Dependentiae bacterium]|nr:MAG: type I methionyl aminopeptidase [Candidatus Dependentiae bacterium]
MIIIKDSFSIDKMKRAGQALATIFSSMVNVIRPGVTTLELNSWIVRELQANGLESQSKGYMEYKYSSCISLNDELVHGVPSAERILNEGELIKVDICAALDGYCADMTRMFIVGQPTDSLSHFVDVACQALNKGIEKARAGNHLSDISAAIQQEVERHGFGIIRDFAGHGIGCSMHEDPKIFNYGEPGKGPILQPGMTFAIEPMITIGHYDVYIADDGWTVKTVDGSLAAHIEDTIAVTDGDPIVLTRISKESGQS